MIYVAKQSNPLRFDPYAGARFASSAKTRLAAAFMASISVAILAVFLSIAALSCAVFATPASAWADESDQATQNGWVVKDSIINYYEDGVLATGFTTINGKKYLFTGKGKQLLGWQNVDGNYYYFSARGKSKGYMRTSKVVNGVRLGKSGKAVLNTSTLAEAKVLCRAQKFIERYAPLGDSKAKRLEKSWKNLIKHAYRSYYIARGLATFHTQHRAFANDLFINHKGDCNSATAAFAYLANALGYKNVKMCSGGFHSWTDVNGKIYDVHWTKVHRKTINVSYSVARARGGSNDWYGGYWYTDNVTYTLAPHSQELAGGKVVVKKASKKGWRENGSVYYLSSGKKATGVRVIKGKLYKFTRKGKLDITTTKAIQRASKDGKRMSKLLKLLGVPNSKQSLPSCYAEDATDWLYKYDHVVISGVQIGGGPVTVLGFSKR